MTHNNKKIKTCEALILAPVVAFVLLGPAAFADEKSDAMAHFETGLALMKSENYSGAALEFETSVGLFESKNALFNLANCYEALHRYRDALDAFDRLESAFGDSLAKDMREAIDRHRQEIGAVVGEIKIEVNVEGATITLNGAEIGKSPIDKPLTLGPDEYSFEISLDKFETVTRKVRLASKQALTVIVELKPMPAELEIVSDVPSAIVSVDNGIVGATPLGGTLKLIGGDHVVRVSKQGYRDFERKVKLIEGEKLSVQVALAAEPSAPRTGQETKQDERKARPSALFWSGLGLTVASAAATGVLWGLAGSAANDLEDANSHVETIPPSDPEAENWKSKQDEAYEDCRLFSNLAVGFGIGAGALAIASGIILGFDLKDKESGVEVSAAPGGLELRF